MERPQVEEAAQPLNIRLQPGAGQAGNGMAGAEGQRQRFAWSVKGKESRIFQALMGLAV